MSISGNFSEHGHREQNAANLAQMLLSFTEDDDDGVIGVGTMVDKNGPAR